MLKFKTFNGVRRSRRLRRQKRNYSKGRRNRRARKYKSQHYCAPGMLSLVCILNAVVFGLTVFAKEFTIEENRNKMFLDSPTFFARFSSIDKRRLHMLFLRGGHDMAIEGVPCHNMLNYHGLGCISMPLQTGYGLLLFKFSYIQIHSQRWHPQCDHGISEKPPYPQSS